MTPDKRKPRPGGNGRGFLEIIALDSGDRSKGTTEVPRNQARRRASFARAMVFEEFRYRHARALDYDGFIDRNPNQLSRWSTARRWWRAAS